MSNYLQDRLLDIERNNNIYFLDPFSKLNKKIKKNTKIYFKNHNMRIERGVLFDCHGSLELNLEELRVIKEMYININTDFTEYKSEHYFTQFSWWLYKAADEMYVMLDFVLDIIGNAINGMEVDLDTAYDQLIELSRLMNLISEEMMLAYFEFQW